MRKTGTKLQPRPRRVLIILTGILAVAVTLATISRSETVAAFTDNVWAGAGFSTGSFGIESSLTNVPEDFDSHSDSPLVLNFDTPITLTPGQTSYAGFYVRRTPGTTEYADVTVSGPTGAGIPPAILWSSYLTFVAKVSPVATTGTTCSADMNQNPAWQPLYNAGTLAIPQPANDAKFTLGESSAEFQAGEPYMVCFEFALNANVVSDAPQANGESVHPTWTFTAKPRQP